MLPELLTLLKSSFSFSQLPKEAQDIFLGKVGELPEDRQKEVITILTQEQLQKEKIDDEAAQKMQTLADNYIPQLKQLEKSFEDAVRKEVENTEKASEEKEMDNLLNNL